MTATRSSASPTGPDSANCLSLGGSCSSVTCLIWPGSMGRTLFQTNGRRSHDNRYMALNAAPRDSATPARRVWPSHKRSRRVAPLTRSHPDGRSSSINRSGARCGRSLTRRDGGKSQSRRGSSLGWTESHVGHAPDHDQSRDPAQARYEQLVRPARSRRRPVPLPTWLLEAPLSGMRVHK
jgi:hypothetical protein